MSENIPTIDPKELYIWSSRMTIGIILLDQVSLQPITTSEGEIQIIPVDRVTDVARAPKRIQDDIEQPNCGVIHQPHRYSFTIAVSANAPAALILKYLLREDAHFHLVIKETDVNNDNYQWVSKIEQFLYCALDNETQTIVVDDVPMCTFTGVGLRNIVQGINALKVYD